MNIYKSNTYCPDRLAEVKELLLMLRDKHLSNEIREIQFVKDNDGWLQDVPGGDIFKDDVDTEDFENEDNGFSFWDDRDDDIDDDAMDWEWEFDFDD